MEEEGASLYFGSGLLATAHTLSEVGFSLTHGKCLSSQVTERSPSARHKVTKLCLFVVKAVCHQKAVISNCEPIATKNDTF